MKGYDEKQRIAWAVVNKDPVKDIDLLANFDSWIKLPSRQVEAIVLSGNSPDDFNEIGSENRVVPTRKILKIVNEWVSIPAHSLTIIKMNKEDVTASGK